MDLKVRFGGGDALVRDILSIVGEDGRKALYSVSAKALQVEVQRHVRKAAQTRHRWSSRLQARPTGHLTKGARAITWHASPSHGVVDVAIPGISRAFGDLTVRPVHAKQLTVPANAASYGRRVSEMRALGWKISRGTGRGRNILFGRRGKERRILYWLRDEVRVPMDRGLLPEDATVTRTVNDAMAREVMRVARKVCSLV